MTAYRSREVIQEPARPNWLLERRSKSLVHDVSQRLKVSESWLVEQLIRRMQDDLDLRGVPTWWPEPIEDDGELPIDSP